MRWARCSGKGVRKGPSKARPVQRPEWEKAGRQGRLGKGMPDTGTRSCRRRRRWGAARGRGGADWELGLSCRGRRKERGFYPVTVTWCARIATADWSRNWVRRPAHLRLLRATVFAVDEGNRRAGHVSQLPSLWLGDSALPIVDTYKTMMLAIYLREREREHELGAWSRGRSRLPAERGDAPADAPRRCGA